MGGMNKERSVRGELLIDQANFAELGQDWTDYFLKKEEREEVLACFEIGVLKGDHLILERDDEGGSRLTFISSRGDSIRRGFNEKETKFVEDILPELERATESKGRTMAVIGDWGNGNGEVEEN